MPEITALLPLVRRKDRVQVYVDGEAACVLSRTVVQEAGLSIGRDLPDATLADIQALDNFHTTLQLAYRYLSYRPRSESEVRTRLRRSGAGLSVVDAVVNRLKEQRLVNDAVFAAEFAEHRTAASPRSRKMVGWELRRKGIDAEVVEEATAELDDEQTAYQAAEKRASRMPEVDYLGFRQKLGGFLQRRGFSYGVCARVVERLWREQRAGGTGETEADG